MTRTTAVVFLVLSAVLGSAGQVLTALNFVAIGAPLAGLGVGVAAIAKMPEVFAGKAQHPRLVVGLLLGGAIATAASQVLTAYGQTAAGASVAGLGLTLAGIAKMQDLLNGLGPTS